jgi:hypothetical protein
MAKINSLIGTSGRISLTEAKKILGITAKGLSDDTIRSLIIKIDALSDVIVSNFNDSKIQSSLDIPERDEHNDG